MSSRFVPWTFLALVLVGTTSTTSAGPSQRGYHLRLGAGYSQGTGDLGDFDTRLQDVAGPGGGVQLDAARRVGRLALGAYGSFARFQRGSDADGDVRIYGASLGLQLTYHLRPQRDLDPWLSVGAGWRTLWLEPTGGTTRGFHGLEVARVQAGTDVRVSPDLAVAPVLGVSLSTYLGQRIASELVENHERNVQVTMYAGLAGSFEL